VLSASNGAEAVAIFVKNLLNVKAAIVDMIMPVMDGTATIQALKTINPEIKIIASSGFDDAKDKPIIE
jgi:two-component system, cell cycle sensor histidine kinase and response regulator CckA